nr:another transcription unit protein [Quercus suber]
MKICLTIHCSEFRASAAQLAPFDSLTLASRARQLDDEELDSGDDEGRADRLPAEAQPEYVEEENIVMDLEFPRQPLPEPSDGELYALKVPDNLEIKPEEFQYSTFQPPTTDHHSREEPSETFSAFNTAMTTIRWRHSPSDPSEMQSNARILRWSDGSITLQLASEPLKQYEFKGNPLAAPQRNPAKPTPFSVKEGNKVGRQGMGAVAGEKFDPSRDSYSYLMVPHDTLDSLLVAHKLTGGLQIKGSDLDSDDAIQRLEAALASAANATKSNTGIIDTSLAELNPEHGREEAERTMREKAKAERRRENAVQRDQERSSRALGRHGLSSGRFGGGLSTDMLEDDEPGGAMRRPRAAPKKRRARRGSEYSDDEDFGRNRFSQKEDEYDQEDDFLAGSDEEEEVEDDDDPDDGIVDEFSRPRQRTPKRAAEADDDDEDAEGEPDDDAPQAAKAKRRRVVDDDEDEE